MESGRVMVGLVNTRWEKGRRVKELFAYGLSCIVWSQKWAEVARIAKLVHRALLLCLPGLDDGSLHAFLCVLETNVVLLLLHIGFYKTGD